MRFYTKNVIYFMSKIFIFVVTLLITLKQKSFVFLDDWLSRINASAPETLHCNLVAMFGN